MFFRVGTLSGLGFAGLRAARVVRVPECLGFRV